MAAARGRKSSLRSKQCSKGSRLHANLIAGTRPTWKGRASEDGKKIGLGFWESGVVPYLQPRAHKCILTDERPTRAERVHQGLSHIALARERTYLSYVMHKYGHSTIPDTHSTRVYI